MNNSQSQKAAARRLDPRKAPSQARAARTVETILEGAAHILERHGLEAYTTNAIAARAGVSIGSLYQYFPTKDAVTAALIERESVELVAQVGALLRALRGQPALRGMIEIAVRHQLRRPRLAKLLDFEQARLAGALPASRNAALAHAALVVFLLDHIGPHLADPDAVATGLMAIIGALTDAAGYTKSSDAPLLVDRIEGAVGGYLAVAGRA
ncbi:MAG: helix-turn-helix domain-containing protein [Pseudomonadota bacterium]